MTTVITCERLEPVAYPLANRFYKQAREKGKTQSRDEVYIARQGQQIVAAVRICPLNGNPVVTGENQAVSSENQRAPESVLASNMLLLRSLAVLPELRRTGVGSRLMSYVAEQLGTRPCWCYPFSWLQTFYEAFGFRVVEPPQAPALVRTPYETYCRQGRDILIMKR